VIEDAPIQQALAFFRRDVLQNIVPLKVLAAYPHAVQAYYHADSAAAGALLLLPTQVSPFDRQAYPSTDYVVLLSATHPRAARALIERVPVGCGLVFKLAGAGERDVVARRFQLTRATAYISYTAAASSQFTPSAEVVVSERLDERCFDLHAAQGYSRDELRGFFAGGRALSFGLYRRGAPVAACFVYPNFEHIYEIGGVYTLPQERRKGHARTLVETALDAIARRGGRPRYVVHEQNRPSIQLAVAIGLEPVVTTEHWLSNAVVSHPEGTR
jgi:GNAT superfamily N-acetyltransferase